MNQLRKVSEMYIVNSTIPLKTPQAKSRPLLPAKVEITAMMKKAKVNGIINFSILAPVNEFLPITSLKKAVKALLAEAGNNNFQYPLIDGSLKCRGQTHR